MGIELFFGDRRHCRDVIVRPQHRSGHKLPSIRVILNIDNILGRCLTARFVADLSHHGRPFVVLIAQVLPIKLTTRGARLFTCLNSPMAESPEINNADEEEEDADDAEGKTSK